MNTVSLITTGGTIASQAVSEGGDVVAEVSGAALRQGLHDPLTGIDVRVEEFANVGSYAIDLPLAFRLCERIRAVLADENCDGVVVTHGTDTMEESAYMADLLIDVDKPVVFTGAQRNAGMPDADGPRNIASAIRLAVAPEARGLGAMICFEGDFHAARDVSKSHTSRVDTFRSGENGKLGEVDGEEVFVQRRPRPRRIVRSDAVETQIELVKLVMGSSDRYLRFAADHGVKGVVLEGFGRGNATPAVTAAAVDLVARGIPVIMTSRCVDGRVRPIYGNGGGRDLERGGVIFAGDLDGPKARVALALLLGRGAGTQELRAIFAELGR